jgi:hypothetical protein
MSIFIVINKTSTKTGSSATPSGVLASLDCRYLAVTQRGTIITLELHEAIPRNGRVKSNKKTCIQSLIITNEILISVLLCSLSVDTDQRHTNTQYRTMIYSVLVFNAIRSKKQLSQAHGHIRPCLNITQILQGKNYEPRTDTALTSFTRFRGCLFRIPARHTQSILLLFFIPSKWVPWQDLT